jgi:hypothetical protein
LGVVDDGSHDYDPGTCQADSMSAGARDLVAKVQLEQNQSLVADFFSESDAITYLVTDCNQIEATWVGGGNSGSAAEHFEYPFQQAGTFVGYLVLDGYEDGFAGTYQATIEISDIAR